MHSSRMRTSRSLTVCCSLLPGGGGVGVVSALGDLLMGGCLLRGGVCSQGVSAPEWGCSMGCLLQGVSAPGGAVCSQGGVGPGPDPPPFPPWGVGLDLIPSISPLGVGLDLIPSISPLGVGLDRGMLG